MRFLIVYLAALVAPGMVWAHVLRYRKGRTCVSIALSVSTLVAALAAARLAGLGPTGLGTLVLACYGVAAVVGLVSSRGHGGSTPWLPRLQPVHVVPVVAVAAVVGYAAWAGPYLEIPADAWWHMGRINDALEEMSRGAIEPLYLSGLLEKDNYYWHTITAFFMHVAGADLETALPYLAAANTGLFCIGVYSFSLLVFDGFVEGPWRQHLMAAATVLFFVVYFGVDVFSYVRYYVFAPGIIIYMVYLAALVSLLGFLFSSEHPYRFLIVGILLALIASMVHFQEAVFIGVMGGAILLVEVIRFFSARRAQSMETLRKWEVGPDASGRRALVPFTVLACVYLAAHVFVYSSVEREDPLMYGLMADIRNYLPFLQNLYILKPTQQFYEVITVWGVLVYILFLVRRRRFAGSPYLVAGMAIPVLTVFNPVFTDFFLRFASPEVLWRMCYVLPLPFVGGYFLVRGAEHSMGAGARGKGLLGVAVVAGLLVLLLPIKTVYFVAPHSKVYTLAPVPDGNSYRLWGDLLDFLETQGESNIITDQVTGYVINGLTRHKYRGYKFYSKYASHVNLSSYDEDFRRKGGWKRLVRSSSFEAEDPWMVVVNTRDGNLSETGLHGGHWPEDVMHVSQQYSGSFLRYVEEEERMFREVWTSDDRRIKVYQVEGT